ncbi:MAG TPA: hypothetical protein VGE07_15770 [Herpetosiphonaceae bacterium]
MSDEALDMLFDESWREVGAMLAEALEPERLDAPPSEADGED